MATTVLSPIRIELRNEMLSLSQIAGHVIDLFTHMFGVLAHRFPRDAQTNRTWIRLKFMLDRFGPIYKAQGKQLDLLERAIFHPAIKPEDDEKLWAVILETAIRPRQEQLRLVYVILEAIHLTDGLIHPFPLRSWSDNGTCTHIGEPCKNHT